MVRPLLLVILHFVFAEPHGSHLIRKRKIEIQHVTISKQSESIQNRLQHRLLSKSNQGPQTGQRIVILAGPHKTASSSIQESMYTWTSTGPQLLPTWSWPVPQEVLEVCEEEAEFDSQKRKCHAKGFYPLAEAINTHDPSHSRQTFLSHSKPEVMGFYRDAMEKEWKDGYNLIIGTEGLDFLVLRDYTNFDNFLSVLPLKEEQKVDNGIEVWGAEKKDVTVVVKFRAPRVQHLISVWHQCCAKKMTFMEFLRTLQGKNERKLHILASLELSEIFLKRGFDVVLMDMGGIIHSGYDISNVVACDILEANCTKEEEILSVSGEEENSFPIIKNVKHNKGNMGGVTDEHLDKIEKVLRKYDCNHQHVLKYENLTVLYNHDLDPILAECSKIEERDRILSRQELATNIIRVVNGANDVDGEYYANTDMYET